MQNHTPGPWAIIDDIPDAAIGYRAIVAIDGENFGETICNPSPMGEANARLIAAAPDLLAALAEIDKLAREAYTDANSRAVLCLQVGLIAQIALDKFTTSS